MDRISAIHKSLTVFVCGIFGVVPILGIVPGVYAIACWRKVRSRYRTEWNPASAYVNWGAALGAIGILNSVLIVFLIALSIVSSSSNY